MVKKKTLARVFKRKANDEESRFYAIFPSIPRPQASSDGDDDASSISTFSTTATVDDNPGTGRILDKYFFQPAGRGVERLAMKFTIRYLHPWRIMAFINKAPMRYCGFLGKCTLSMMLDIVDHRFDGPTIVTGLKSLVRQTQ